MMNKWATLEEIAEFEKSVVPVNVIRKALSLV